MTQKMGRNSWHGIKTQQMRSHLINHNGYTKEQVNEVKGKASLIKLMDEHNISPSDVLYHEKPELVNAVKSVFNDIEEENGLFSNGNECVESDSPSYESPEWHDYVMGHFTPNELVNGYPKCDGLRRVTELLLGKVITSKPVNVFPSMDPNGPGRATVQYEVEIVWKLDGDMFSATRVFGDVADVYMGNSPGVPYVLHTVATACTRAESRTLRKALRLRTISFEEMMEGDPNEIMDNYSKNSNQLVRQTSDWVAEDKISQQQEDMITIKCSEMNIDVVKFINKKFYTGEAEVPSFTSLKEVPRSVAASMIQELVKYQSNTKESVEIPKEILLSS